MPGRATPPTRLLALALGATLPFGTASASWQAPGGAVSPADSPEVALAKAELARGQRLYDEARYEEALAAFEAAWRAYPRPEFQFDMGLCHERLGHVEHAIAAFETYLAQKPDAPDRPNIEERIARLRARLPAQVEPAPPPPPAVIERAPPPPPPAPRPTVTPHVDGDPHAGRAATVAGAITLSLGLAIGVGGGVGFGLPAARRVREVEAALAADAPPDDRLTPEQARRTARAGDRWLALQLASIGVGAVLLGTGIGLLVAGKRKRSERVQAMLAPARGGLAIGGAVRW